MSFLNELKLKMELRKYTKDDKSGVWIEKKKRKNNKRILVWLIVSIGIYTVLRTMKYSQISYIISTFIFFGGIVFEIMENNKKLKEEIKQMSKEQDYMESKVVHQVQAQEVINKQNIKHIILKDDEGYDVKTWKMDHLTCLVIGKDNPRNHVEIDLSKSTYSSLISREHGILNKVDDGWYFEDLGSMNGSGVEKKDSGRKMKVRQGVPVKVESGDTIHISNTKLLLS